MKPSYLRNQKYKRPRNCNPVGSGERKIIPEKRQKKGPERILWAFKKEFLAATYSPTQNPVQYHWPWRS